MPDNKQSGSPTAILLGALAVIAAAAAFVLSGGELGGKKTVLGDADLPPIASGPTK